MMLIWFLLLFAVSLRAEEEFFLKTNITTWNDARRHCQECYKELVTITPSNAQCVAELVGGNASFNSWIGLRQNLSGSILWSRWANGAPVVYQNWYPGHPVQKKKPVPLPTCPAPSVNTSILDNCPTLAQILNCLNATASCSNSTANCSMANDTVSSVFRSGTTFAAQTSTPVSTCTNVSSVSNETDSEYIDDSCVAMLGFGMWKEMNCSTLLPYICYDDRFYGVVNISNVTQSGAYLSWGSAPGVSRYIVNIVWQQSTNVSACAKEINSANPCNVSDWSNSTEILNATTDEQILGKQIKMLQPGTIYRVQIVPVRCNRTLNPQNISFYTLPQKITNLRVLQVTKNEIKVNWSKPDGGLDQYLINVSNTPHDSKTEEFTITNLNPGVFYRIQVSAVVNKSTLGVPDTRDVYTKPSPVLSLTSFNNESNKITASWRSTDVNSQNYLYNVTLMGSNTQNKQTNESTMTFSDLVSGTKYKLTVSALANYTVEGEEVTISAYTLPQTVEGLKLECTEESITATWDSSKGNFTFFHLVLSSSVSSNVNATTNGSYYMFTKLKAATLYSVTVTTYVDELKSVPASISNYTRPVRPGPATVKNLDSTTVNLSWIVPEQLEGVKDILYSVKYLTRFWGENGTYNVSGINYIVIPGLRPGTMYDYNITVLAGKLESIPRMTNNLTVPNNRSLTLMMLCSSAKKLSCIQNNTMNAMLQELNDYINNTYGLDIFWSLKWNDE